MAIGQHKVVIRIATTLIVALIIAITWPIVSIPLRLSRNGAIAADLVATLHADYPGVRFRGSASYEQEVIYISVVEGSDKIDRKDLERWLREKRIDDNIAPAIYLTFSVGFDDQSIRIEP